MTLLEDSEWVKWSNREIARKCGVSLDLVNRARNEGSLNDSLSDERTYTTKHGTPSVMNTSRIGKTPEDKWYCDECRESHIKGRHTGLHNRIPIVTPGLQSVESAPAPLIELAPKRYISVNDWERMTDKQKQKALAAQRSPSFHFNQTNDNVEWAMWTWNPITGCLHNCTYCYARDIAMRFYEQGFEPSFLPERLDGPKNTKVPERAKSELGYGNVFTCSMADLFGKWVPQEWIDAVLAVMWEQSQWNYLTLTKFPQRLSEQNWPKNTWVGASIDRQARVRETLKCFDKVKRKSNAEITWLSLEPLLEPLKFDSLAMFDMVVIGGASASTQTPEWIPPSGWIADIMQLADRDGAAVYLKTNGRPREYPGRKPSFDIQAPEQFGLVQLSK
jgi:protein gp37